MGRTPKIYPQRLQETKMFRMEIFRTFPSNYVEAQKHGNERRITIGDFNSQARRGRNPPDRETYETLWTRKPAKEERGVDKLQEDLMLSGRDTQLLMRDKNRPNQSDEDIECRSPPSKAMLGLGLHVSAHDWRRPKKPGSLLNSYKYAPPAPSPNHSIPKAREHLKSD
ncbi:unnamed protein product [Microthlaspi erraticum]|uniref:Uncharacterized protein n=1 Tax=Microthlaspi erraticum TaxID=1685480 RepID=A0A6D2JD08_9BRAS|nr:unnamed protein product [Microthlaspi erraticum]